ncbi:DMT family transporter [Streptomyces spiralis]|uniref:DMT family transporter n=1 Tax=Streptomyces spiralis TaxID=66376 RepID=UPI0033CCA43A
MNVLTVVLALLAASANAAASVLMRRAATEKRAEEATGRARGGWSGRRRWFWTAGAGLLAGSGVVQAAALAVGSLSLVQPLLATELLFTLAIGSVVFHRRPDRATWLSFLALAVGLALFLGAAAPSSGRITAEPGRWVPVGSAVGCLVLALAGASRLVCGAPRAALLGLASAVMFALTAALLKQVTGQLPKGLGHLAADWTPYATAVTGLVAFGLLQCAFRAGTLVASQPALTLGDALTSVALGWALFGEHIALGVRMVPEAIGVGLLAAGTVGLARAPAVSGQWDTEPPPPHRRGRHGHHEGGGVRAKST